jgi:CheY-like chemotaxis protein
MNGEILVILLIEDNMDHAELVKRSFKEHQVANRIHHVSDGKEALDFLFRKGEYSDPAKSPRPHVILLDLRLPMVDGMEVLKKIKAEKDLHNIPVVVLTSSEAEKDVIQAYNNNVNSYLVKPLDFKKFTKLMNVFGFYWLAWNRKP